MFVFFIADTQTADKISLRVVLTCISLMAGEDRPFFHDFKKKNFAICNFEHYLFIWLAYLLIGLLISWFFLHLCVS